MPDAVKRTDLEKILAQSVFVRGTNVAFGELTADDVRARADELRASVGFGPTARVAPVAMAWRELANAMVRGGAETVAQLHADALIELAPRLWIVPPAGGLL
jgi:hypothetical protein